MKRIIILFILLFFICGCSKVSFNGKTYIYKNNNMNYIYDFISNSLVSYKYGKGNNLKTYKCNYTIETNNMIKVVCDNDVRLLLYDRDNDCIYDYNSRVYCFK